MNFDDTLALIAAVISGITFLLVVLLTFRTKKPLFLKIGIAVGSFFLVLPLWYAIQTVVTTILAKTIPDNPIVNCIYLDEAACQRRQDCIVSYAFGGLNKNDHFLCSYKPSQEQEKANCEDTQGIWRFYADTMGKDYQTGYCYYPTSDQGQQCYQDSDCEVSCVSTGETDTDGYILGKCGKYSLEVCAPTIPNKTKSRAELKGGPCM